MSNEFAIRASWVSGLPYKIWCLEDNFEFDTDSRETFFEVLQNHINTKHKEVPIGTDGVPRSSDADASAVVYGDAGTSAQSGDRNQGATAASGTVSNRVWTPPVGVPVRIESSDFDDYFNAPWRDA